MFHRTFRPTLLFLFLVLNAMCFAVPVLYNGVDVDAFARQSLSRGRTVAMMPLRGTLWIVSPANAVGPRSRSELEKAGWQVVAFIPRDGFLVRVRDAARTKVSLSSTGSHSSLRFGVPLKPEWKISPGLQTLASSLISADREFPLVVCFVSPSRSVESVIVKSGGLVTSRPRTPGKGRLGVKIRSGDLPAFLQSIAALGEVYCIQPGSGARLLNDNASAIVQSGTATGGRPIWHRGLHGEGQTIAILDTGLDYDSCYFSEDDDSPPPLAFGTETGSPDPSRRKVLIYDFLYSGDWGAGLGDFDNEGHGTYVAGNAVGSQKGNPFGESVKNGIAPGAKLVVQDAGFVGFDACSDLAALGCPVVDLTPFLDQAVAQGANFQSDSWGDQEDAYPQNNYTGPTADMDDITWRHPEFLICCAAGNSASKGLNSVGSPSVAKNVLSVGATLSPTIGGSSDVIASFSSIGWASDGRLKPDLTAPGVTLTASSDYDVTTSNCTISLVEGTSMAAPITAACCAIVRQYFTEGWYPNGVKTPADAFVPSAALIKADLLNGTVDMSETSTPPPNRYEGWGRVQLENSLYFAGDARHVIALDERDAFTTDSLQPFVYRFYCDGNSAGGLVKVTLVWTDPPANPGASIALVNDLDLLVDDTATTTSYWGNHFDFSNGNDGYTHPGGGPDHVNNVEMVILPATTRGFYDVHVTPGTVVQPPQGFALVIGGSVVPTELLESRADWILY